MGVLTFGETRHLVSRTGLGAEWGTIKRLQGKTKEEAVDLILNQPSSRLIPVPALTPWLTLEPMRLADMKDRNTAWGIAQKEGKKLQAWWIEQMLVTQTPFAERMTLFWHNHFVSSIQKTLQPSLLYKQNLLLREHALGSFSTLLQEIARDPAMLVYLDGYQNVKDQPNENFARELLELFTVGRGAYNEADIKAAAKAFTGWSIDTQGRFVQQPEQHSSDTLTFMGKQGQFKGNDIIAILLANPRTAERIVDKIWCAFVSSNKPNPAITKPWAEEFRQTNYNIKALMKTVLTSDVFWSPQNRGTLVKSPVELLIGTVRTLPYPRESTDELLNLCRLLGQELFDAPNVKGWAGGQEWINTQTLLVRTSYLAKLSRGSLDESVQLDTALPSATPEEIIEWLLPVKPLKPLPATPGNRRLVRALLLDPAFQVT